MKKQIITAIAVVAIAGVSSADVLFDSAFDGNTGAVVLPGNTDNASGSAAVAITDWTTDASVTAISGLTAISPGAGFAQLQGGTAAFAGPNNIYINNNLNVVDRANPRGYSLTFTTDTSWNLTTLTVRAGHTNNQGTQNQAYVSDLTISLAGGDIVGAITQTIGSIDYAGVDYIASAFDLSSFADIGAGDYTLSVTVNNMVGGGAYAIYDGVTLQAIPEPATLGMVALFGGGILFVRRRLMI